MRPRWRKITADFWGNLVRSLLVIASIAVGLFAIGILVTILLTLHEDMPRGYAAVNPANIQMTVSFMDEDLLDQINNVPGVGEAEGLRIVTLRIRNTSGDWVNIKLYASKDPAEMNINRYTLVEGEKFPQEREVVMERNKVAALGVDVGSDLVVELPSGKVRRLPVVGIVKDQTLGAANTGGGYFTAPAQGYITTDTLTWLEQPDEYNTIIIRAATEAKSAAELRALADDIRHEVESAGKVALNTTVRLSSEHPNNVYVNAMAGILLLLGFMVVFLSAFLITTTFQALLTQQTGQIGVMKLVGARSGQIMVLYLALTLVFGLIAFGIALPLSSSAAQKLLVYLASGLNFELQASYHIYPLVIWVLLALALIVPVSAAYLPIHHGVQITIQEAVSGITVEKGKGSKNWVLNLLMRVRSLSRPLMLSLRNTFRRRGRLLLTLTTLSLGGAIFIGTFNVQLSIRDYVERVSQYFLADVNINLTGLERIKEVESTLANIPEVKFVEGWAGANAEILLPDDSVADTVSVVAPPAGSKLVDPIMLAGRWVKEGDHNAIAVSERFSDLFPDLKMGDTLRLKINGDITEWTIVGQFQLVGSAGGYLAYTDYESMSKILHSENMAASFRVQSVQENLSLTQQKEFARLIEAPLIARGLKVNDTEAGLSLIEKSTDGLNILTTFLVIMAMLIALVGSIGLTGTMSMNVMERTREIGILRAVGASDTAITNMVLVEGVLIGLMSWGLGTLLSFPVSYVLSQTINQAIFGSSGSISFTPIGVGVWLVVVLILSFFASILPARSAARLTIREILAYE